MNITEVLEDLRIPFKEEGHEHCRAGWVQVDCPLCTMGQERWRCGINLTYNYANCWQCGSMTLEYLIYNSVGGYSKSQIKKLLVGLDRGLIKDKEHVGKLKLPDRIRPLLYPHINYLKNRKFNPKSLEKQWGIGALAQQKGRLAWRIFIPIHLQGQIVAWTARALHKDNDPRYLFAKDEHCTIPCKQLLYGEDFVRQAIIVTEGPFDVWRIGPGAVATFGTSLTSFQVERISKYPKRIICFDSEPSAQRLANDLADSLEVFPGETIVVELQSGKDPDTADKKEIQELRRLLK